MATTIIAIMLADALEYYYKNEFSLPSIIHLTHQFFRFEISLHRWYHFTCLTKICNYEGSCCRVFLLSDATTALVLDLTSVSKNHFISIIIKLKKISEQNVGT